LANIFIGALTLGIIGWKAAGSESTQRGSSIFESEAAGNAASQQRKDEKREMARGDCRQIILVVEDERQVRGLTVMT
jgi:hypothetical protein